MHIRICFSLIFFFSSTAVFAQPGNAEELHNGLRLLKNTMEEALNKGDIDAILENVDERVVFTTMNDDVVRGKQGVRVYFERMMLGPDRVVEKITSKFEVDDLSILHGNNTAIAFGHTEDQYTLAGGNTIDIKARWSATMFLKKGKWVVGSFHYSTNMFDNPILDAQRNIFLWIIFAVLLVALALGFFLGRRSASA